MYLNYNILQIHKLFNESENEIVAYKYNQRGVYFLAYLWLFCLLFQKYSCLNNIPLNNKCIKTYNML